MAPLIMADWRIHRILKEVMNPVQSFAPAKTECFYLFQKYSIMEKPCIMNKVLTRCPLFLTCLVGGCRRLDKQNKYEHAKETQIYNIIYEKTKQTKEVIFCLYYFSSYTGMTERNGEGMA